MIPTALLIIAILTFYLITTGKPRTAEAALYRSIMRHGCGDCGSNFDAHPSNEYRSIDILKCQNCGRRYHVDATVQHAWDIL